MIKQYERYKKAEFPAQKKSTVQLKAGSKHRSKDFSYTNTSKNQI